MYNQSQDQLSISFLLVLISGLETPPATCIQLNEETSMHVEKQLRAGERLLQFKKTN